MATVHDDEGADLRIDQRQTRDLLGQVDNRGPNALGLQDLGENRDGGISETEPPPLLHRCTLPLLDRVPSASGLTNRVHRRRRGGASTWARSSICT